MKKLLGILVLGLLLAGCSPEYKMSNQETPYSHWARVELVIIGVNYQFYEYGNSRAEAIENALAVCEITKERLSGYCRVAGSCLSNGSSCSWGKEAYNDPPKRTVKSSSSSSSPQISLADLKKTCMEFGYKEGTEKLADCMKELYLDQTQPVTTTTTSKPKRKIDPSVWDDLLNVSKGLGEGKTLTESLGGTTTGTTKIQCFKTGERVSGTNKICSYNCMGSETTTNIASTRICPLSIDLN